MYKRASGRWVASHPIHPPDLSAVPHLGEPRAIIHSCICPIPTDAQAVYIAFFHKPGSYNFELGGALYHHRYLIHHLIWNIRDTSILLGVCMLDKVIVNRICCSFPSIAEQLMVCLPLIIVHTSVLLLVECCGIVVKGN